MQWIEWKENQKQVHLIADYFPNKAMKNTFQTQTFLCTLHSIETKGQCLQGYQVDKQAQFVLFHVSLYNLTSDIITIYKEDIRVCFDEVEPYEAEDYFGVWNQFENEIVLTENEMKKGCFVFLIATQIKRLEVQYYEFVDMLYPKIYRMKYQLK